MRISTLKERQRNSRNYTNLGFSLLAMEQARLEIEFKKSYDLIATALALDGS